MLRWQVILAGSLFVVGLVAALVLVTSLGGGDSSSNEHATRILTSARALRTGQQDGATLGAADAPLELEVFEDFQCPYCVLFTANVEPALISEYVDTGKVKLTFRNFPILGMESVASARASVCAADQDLAWSLGLDLFHTQAAAGQAERERVDVGRFDRTALGEAAARAGLDTDAFNACMDDPRSAQTVRDEQARGTALGVRGTPSFALNGQLLTSVPSDIAGWRTLLDAASSTVTR